MRYVLDSSAAFKWVVPELHSDKALRLRANFQAGVDELVSPDVFPGSWGTPLPAPNARGGSRSAKPCASGRT
jgi:hypothetical protein